LVTFVAVSVLLLTVLGLLSDFLAWHVADLLLSANSGGTKNTTAMAGGTALALPILSLVGGAIAARRVWARGKFLAELERGLFRGPHCRIQSQYD
jgi:hypothetical protein